MKRAWTYRDLQNKPLPKQRGLDAEKEAQKRKEPKLSESQQQTECMRWFRQEYPQFANNCFAVPNGGFRNPKTAAILKREGVLSGVPDVCLAVARNPYHGLYLELKVKGNKPTENQLAVMAALKEQGYCCEVVYSTEEFKEVITKYLNAA